VRVPIQSISVVLKLACLADIFNYLNTVNTSMQGKNENHQHFKKKYPFGERV